MQGDVKAQPPPGIEVRRWVIQQLKLRLDYLKLIASRGYDVKDEIPKLENEIKESEQQLEPNI